MQLVDLEAKSTVSLEVIANNNRMEFKSFVVSKMNGYLVLEAVRVEGRVINFESSNIIINLLWIREGEVPMIWNRVAIRNIPIEGRTYYIAACMEEGSEINRRGAFRLYTGIEGLAQLGSAKPAFDVLVKNVSETGFSFISNDAAENTVNSTVRLAFFDLNKKFNLTGNVVRVEQLEDGRCIYGCSLLVTNNVLNQYINEKQRDMLSKQSDRYSNSRPQPVMADKSKVDKKNAKAINQALLKKKLYEELLSGEG